VSEEGIVLDRLKEACQKLSALEIHRGFQNLINHLFQLFSTMTEGVINKELFRKPSRNLRKPIGSFPKNRGKPVRLIFKNLNILRSALNAISTASGPKGIIESTGTYLPSLFSFASFGIFWKEGLLLHLYQDESCLPSFTKEVAENIFKVFSIFGEESIDITRLNLIVDKKGANPDQKMGAKTALKSHLTLPLAVEGKVLGCISLDSEQPNAFDVQDLQFFSVIGYR